MKIVGEDLIFDLIRVGNLHGDNLQMTTAPYGTWKVGGSLEIVSAIQMLWATLFGG